MMPPERNALARELAGNAAAAALFVLFLFNDAEAFRMTGSAVYVLVALNMGICVMLFLVRERPVAVSALASDWLIAFSAAFLGLLLRPAAPMSEAAGAALLAAGTAVNIASVLFLNRSFGLVPAERSIKTGGLYRVVRHPMYASGILTIVGYLLANASLMNAAIVVTNIALLVVRIVREERFLCANERYRQYAARTRWKLLPFVY
ncbi:MAG TPA: methyltransferase [Candidatus Paceibacterota bacterium]|nr:methyltransferase [Candidatus Paceibacterota bacterium]